MIKNIEIRINLSNDDFIFVDQVLYSDSDKSGLVDQRGYIMDKKGNLIAILEERLDQPLSNPIDILKELREERWKVVIINKQNYEKIRENLSI